MKQKTINQLLISLLIFGIFACSNDSSTSPMFTKFKVDFKDLHIYIGTPTGADSLIIQTNSSWNKDSLYQTRTTYGYFGTDGNDLAGLNRISFEFLGDNNEQLSFADIDMGMRLISSYVYHGDSLFILKEGVLPIFVANKAADGSFYRTISLQRAMIKSIAEPLDVTERFDGDKKLDINSVLDLAGFPNKEAMTSKKDTVIWSNVKYTYR